MEMPEEVHQVQMILSSMQKSLECRICLDLLVNPSQTKCGHTFCTECLHQLTKKPAPCPLCKVRLTRRSFATDHQAAALAAAVRRLVAAVQEDCGFNVSPSKYRPRPSIEATETATERQPTASASKAVPEVQTPATANKKQTNKNVRAAGRARHRRSPPRHVYSRAAAAAADELDLLSASQVLEFDGERVGEALGPPPPPLPADAERRVSGRTRVSQWLGGAREAGFGITEVESPGVERLDRIRQEDGGRLERRLQEEKRRLGVAPLDEDGDDDKENRGDVSVTAGTVGGVGGGGEDGRKVVDESVDDAESARGREEPSPAPAGAKRFFKTRTSPAQETPSGQTQTETGTETETPSAPLPGEEDPYLFISSQRTPPKKKKKQRAGKKAKPPAAKKKLTVTKKAPAAVAEEGGTSVAPPADFDSLEPEAAASRRRAPPRRARQAAVRAADALALPSDLVLSQESGADSDFEPPAQKRTRRVRSGGAAKPPPAPVTPKLLLARAELGTASQEVRAIQQLFDDAAAEQVTPRGGRAEAMTRAEAIRRSGMTEGEAVTPKSVTFSEDVEVKEIPCVRQERTETSPGVDDSEMQELARSGAGELEGPSSSILPPRERDVSKAQVSKHQALLPLESKPQPSKTLVSKPQVSTSEGNEAPAAAPDDNAPADPPSQCELNARQLAAAGLPPPAAARSPGWSRLPRLKSSFGVKGELAVRGGRRTPTKCERRPGDATAAVARADDPADDPPPSPTNQIDEAATASSEEDPESEGFTVSQRERTGRRVSQYRRALRELETEVLALETEPVDGETEPPPLQPPPVPETEVGSEDEVIVVGEEQCVEDIEGGTPPPPLTPNEAPDEIPAGVKSLSSGASKSSGAAPPPLLAETDARGNTRRSTTARHTPTGSGGRGDTLGEDSESLLPASEPQRPERGSEVPASESVIPDSETVEQQPPAGPSVSTAGSSAGSATPDSEDFLPEEERPTGGCRRSGRRAGRLSRTSPRGSGSGSGDGGTSTKRSPADVPTSSAAAAPLIPPSPAAPGRSPGRRAGAGAGRRRAVCGRRGAASRRLLRQLLVGQRRLTALVGRLTTELGRLRGGTVTVSTSSPAPAPPSVAADTQAAAANRREVGCGRPPASVATPPRTATRRSALSPATPVFSPSARPAAGSPLAPTAAAGTASPATSVLQRGARASRSPRASSAGSQVGRDGGARCGVVEEEAASIGSPRASVRKGSARLSGSARTTRTRSSGSSHVPPSKATPSGSASLKHVSPRRLSSTAPAKTPPAPNTSAHTPPPPGSDADIVAPSQPSQSIPDELSALMCQDPAPAPESAPSAAFPADSEDIPLMSVTQLERVAREMDSEAAPPPPRDLCDLDTEEVDSFMGVAPAVVGVTRRSGSGGSQKRASPAAEPPSGSKRRRSDPATPASAGRGTREDPEVVSEDEKVAVEDGDQRGLGRDEEVIDRGDRLATRGDEDRAMDGVDEQAESEQCMDELSMNEQAMDEQAVEEEPQLCSRGRTSGEEPQPEVVGSAEGGSGSTDSPVCRGPGRRAARISYDDGEQEPEPTRQEEDEFGSDGEDRAEMERLAAMPVDEFIREIQGEVGGVPVGESTRRASGEADESIDGRQRKSAEVDAADDSITEAMMQEADIPAADESISEIPADTSVGAHVDEPILDREGRPSRSSAGRSLNDIDPDLTGPPDLAPPNSQDSLAEIVVSSGEVASPRRVAQLDTVLVTPGGRRRSTPGRDSPRDTPKTTRRSGRSMTGVRLAAGTPGVSANASATGSDATPRAELKTMPGAESSLRTGRKSTPGVESKLTPRAESKLTPRAESKLTPRAELKLTPRAESKLTPRAESKSTPRVESKSTPRAASNLTPGAESGIAPPAESESAPRAPESDLIPASLAAPLAESAPRAPESDLIPASPAAPAAPAPAPAPLRRVSQAGPPASPSSEDLLVPAGFFNESSLCVPAAEASLAEAGERGAERGEADGETTRRRESGEAASAAATTADQSDPAGPVGGRRSAPSSAAPGAERPSGAAPDAAAAAGEVSETESEDMFCASRPTDGTAALVRKPDSPPPPPRRPPPVMVASGLKRAEQEAAQRLATAHGGRFLRQWQPGVTHVIVRTGPRLEAGRTLKFLQGVAARAWLVSPGWVADCLSADRLLTEEDYEAIDGATGEPGPRRARLAGGSLFAGFVFCCVEPFRDVTLEQLEALIGQSGGAVAGSPAALASAPGRVRLVVAQEECDHDFGGWRRRHGVPSVSYEWLIDCVATQRLWSLLDNTLCGATEAELRQAGVPQELCLAETQETEYFDSMGL